MKWDLCKQQPHQRFLKSIVSENMRKNWFYKIIKIEFLYTTFTNIISGSGGGASSSVVGSVSITENSDLLISILSVSLPLKLFYCVLRRQPLFYKARYFKVKTNKHESMVILNAEWMLT